MKYSQLEEYFWNHTDKTEALADGRKVIPLDEVIIMLTMTEPELEEYTKDKTELMQIISGELIESETINQNEEVESSEDSDEEIENLRMNKPKAETGETSTAGNKRTRQEREGGDLEAFLKGNDFYNQKVKERNGPTLTKEVGLFRINIDCIYDIVVESQ